MKKQNPILNRYNDVLYYATSTRTSKESFHLSRLDADVLQKLIHYDKTNPKITYSNKVIGEHTFIPEATVKDSIPRLKKAGYINCVDFILSSGKGEIKKRRIININWSFIEEILSLIPVSTEEVENEVEQTKSDEEIFINNLSFVDKAKTIYPDIPVKLLRDCQALINKKQYPFNKESFESTLKQLKN